MGWQTVKEIIPVTERQKQQYNDGKQCDNMYVYSVYAYMYIMILYYLVKKKEKNITTIISVYGSACVHLLMLFYFENGCFRRTSY